MTNSLVYQYTVDAVRWFTNLRWWRAGPQLSRKMRKVKVQDHCRLMMYKRRQLQLSTIKSSIKNFVIYCKIYSSFSQKSICRTPLLLNTPPSWPCCVQIIERLKLCRKQSPGLERYQEGRCLFICFINNSQGTDRPCTCRSLSQTYRNWWNEWCHQSGWSLYTQSLIPTRNFPQWQDTVWWFRSMPPFLCGIYAWQHAFSSDEV